MLFRNKLPDRKIRALCPICKKSFSFEIDSEIIKNSKRFPIPFTSDHYHEGNVLVVYIDKNYEVRHVEQVHSTKNMKNIKELQDKLIVKLPPDHHIIYGCNLKCEEIRAKEIPNIIEKRLLNIISKEKEISLIKILENCRVMEKALNRKIEIGTIKKLLEKYVSEGVIFKREIVN